MNPFQECRERLDMLTVARHYGHEPNRAGFIRCPFHAGDRTASLKIYPGQRGWHCFGCGKGGSVIDFVALDLGLAPLDAVRRLNKDFHLGIPLDQKPTEVDWRDAQHRQEVAQLHQAFEVWREQTIRKLNEAFRAGHLALQEGKPLDQLTEAEALAIREQAQAEYLADLLAKGTPAEQMEVLRCRGEVKAWIEEILHHLPTKSGAA